MSDVPRLPGENKSSFVTVLAWIFIVLSSFSTLMSVFQNIMVQAMFNDPAFTTAMTKANQSKNMPVFAEFMFNNFRLVLAAFLIVSLTALVSAIGLLHRKNWARLAFIGVMTLGIAWNIFGLCLNVVMFSSLSAVPQPAADESMMFQSFAIVTLIFSIAIAVGFSILFGWIIKRLVSLSIKHEFGIN